MDNRTIALVYKCGAYIAVTLAMIVTGFTLYEACSPQRVALGVGVLLCCTRSFELVVRYVYEEKLK